MYKKEEYVNISGAGFLFYRLRFFIWVFKAGLYFPVFIILH